MSSNVFVYCPINIKKVDTDHIECIYEGRSCWVPRHMISQHDDLTLSKSYRGIYSCLIREDYIEDLLSRPVDG